MTSLYGLNPLLLLQLITIEDFVCKTATLDTDLQVCMGPRPNVWYWALITACLEQEYQVYMGSSHHLWFCALQKKKKHA